MRLLARLLSKLKSYKQPTRYGLEVDAHIMGRLEELAAYEKRPLKEITDHVITTGIYDFVGEEEKVYAWNSLSKREQQITASVCQSLTNKEIAQRFRISVPTVKSHLTRIFLKVGVKNRAQLQTYFDWDFKEWV